jgi:hypothetical protein
MKAKEQIEQGKVPWTRPEFNDSRYRDVDDMKAEYLSKRIKKANEDAAIRKGMGRATYNEVTYLHGVMLLLPDGSAAWLEANVLNELAAYSPPANSFMVARTRTSPLLVQWNPDAEETDNLFRYVPAAFYPTEVWGCPVIAVGRR